MSTEVGGSAAIGVTPALCNWLDGFDCVLKKKKILVSSRPCEIRLGELKGTLFLNHTVPFEC